MKIIALAGPTAVGKSEAALRLAGKLGGEIVSVDSMQVYRGLDVGTAKPSSAQRAQVPHHLVDVAELSDTFDAARFVHLAREAIAGIHERGRVAILCGGTGLYYQALLEGLGNAPPGDPVLRTTLEAIPLRELLRELGEQDPTTFATIDQRNARRVIRAVEVLRLTGRPFSEQKAEWMGAEIFRESPGGLCVLTREPAELRQRINDRVDNMFRRGLVAETADLLKRGLAQNRTACQALGYRQVLEHLRGERRLEETMDLVKIRTRQYAKRQMTWFRKYGAARPMRIEPGSPASAVVDLIESHLETGGLWTF
jgi:tRNA dimethylallyltransferase